MVSRRKIAHLANRPPREVDAQSAYVLAVSGHAHDLGHPLRGVDTESAKAFRARAWRLPGSCGRVRQNVQYPGM